MNATLRREHWDGHPVELGDSWILRKGVKVARCILATHPLGLGAALDDDGLVALAGLSLVRGSLEYPRTVEGGDAGEGLALIAGVRPS